MSALFSNPRLWLKQIKAVTPLPDITIEEVIDLIPDEEFYYTVKNNILQLNIVYVV